MKFLTGGDGERIMHTSRTAWLITAVLVLGGSPAATGGHQSQGSRTPSQITELVGLLWSPDKVARDDAKRNLFRLGQASVIPLTDLLQDLIRREEPQFETGKEEEGRKFLERHYHQPSDASEIERVMTVEVSWRIKQDIVEVLTRLKARDAVPLLIDSLNSGIQVGSATHEHMRPEMEMLRQFGAIAVPELNKAIDTAEETVNGKPNNSTWTPEENRLYKLGQTQSRQAKLPMVIGEIGDDRSMPVLEHLLAQLRDKGDRAYTIMYIEKAITKIKEKNK